METGGRYLLTGILQFCSPTKLLHCGPFRLNCVFEAIRSRKWHLANVLFEEVVPAKIDIYATAPSKYFREVELFGEDPESCSLFDILASLSVDRILAPEWQNCMKAIVKEDLNRERRWLQSVGHNFKNDYLDRLCARVPMRKELVSQLLVYLNRPYRRQIFGITNLSSAPVEIEIHRIYSEGSRERGVPVVEQGGVAPTVGVDARAEYILLRSAPYVLIVHGKSILSLVLPDDYNWSPKKVEVEWDGEKFAPKAGSDQVILSEIKK